MDEKFECCICGNESEGYGNNPWPVVADADARCCDKCNETRVIPARIKKAIGADGDGKLGKDDIERTTARLMSLFMSYVNEPSDSDERAARDADVYPMVFGANLLYNMLCEDAGDKKVIAAIGAFRNGFVFTDRDTGAAMRTKNC